jgi:hypothetical protein
MNQKVAAPFFLMPSQKSKKWAPYNTASDEDSEILSETNLRVSQYPKNVGFSLVYINSMTRWHDFQWNLPWPELRSTYDGRN